MICINDGEKMAPCYTFDHLDRAIITHYLCLKCGYDKRLGERDGRDQHNNGGEVGGISDSDLNPDHYGCSGV